MLVERYSLLRRKTHILVSLFSRAAIIVKRAVQPQTALRFCGVIEILSLGDCSRKMILTNDTIPAHRLNNGVYVMNVCDYLLDN